MLPGWYGVGSAIEQWVGADETRWDEFAPDVSAMAVFPIGDFQSGYGDCQNRYGDCAKRYTELVEDAALAERIFGEIIAEWKRVVHALFIVTGHSALLATNQTLARSLRNRLPYLDPLNYFR